MARLARLYAPDTVQHVVQRPVAGRVLFVDGDDYALFVALLDEAVRAHAVALHAYLLMPDQVRLIATPAASGAIGRAMQAIGRRYVPHLNRKTARDGPLWDRRYRSTLIDAEGYLLAAMRHVERQPVRDALVVDPAEWRWSSYAHHAGHAQQAFVSDHAAYWALSDTPFARQAAYRAFAETDGHAALGERIERSVERGWALGDLEFVARIDAVANRRVTPLPRGRKQRLKLR